MKREKVSAADIIGMIPAEKLDFLAAVTRVDHKVHKLTGRTMFELLVYSIIAEHSVSLRIMEEVFASAQFSLLNKTAATTTTRFTSIRDRIDTINADYFRELFSFCAARFASQLACDRTLVCPDNEHNEHNEHKGSLIRFDSTMVALSAKLFNEKMGGMRVGRNTDKLQIKFTIGFNGLLSTAARVFSEQRELSEDITLAGLIRATAFSKGDVVTFDRGVSSRSTLSALAGAAISYVSRINTTIRYEAAQDNLLKEPVEVGRLLLIEDRLVYLFGSRGRMREPVRLIKAEGMESGEAIWFISNLDAGEFSAAQISELYRRRWDIEVFFKFLKRELDLSHLPVRSRNGVEVVLYTKLIVAMLLLAYRELNGMKGYKLVKLRFARELDYALMREVVIICGGDPAKIPLKT